MEIRRISGLLKDARREGIQWKIVLQELEHVCVLAMPEIPGARFLALGVLHHRAGQTFAHPRWICFGRCRLVRPIVVAAPQSDIVPIPAVANNRVPHISKVMDARRSRPSNNSKVPQEFSVCCKKHSWLSRFCSKPALINVDHFSAKTLQFNNNGKPPNARRVGQPLVRICWMFENSRSTCAHHNHKKLQSK